MSKARGLIGLVENLRFSESVGDLEKAERLLGWRHGVVGVGKGLSGDLYIKV